MQQLHILWIIGASQGILLALLMALKKDRAINLPLILFVFLTSVELFFQYLYATKTIFKYPHLLYLTEPFSMLGGVLIYLYARNVLLQQLQIKKTDILYFIPFLLYLLYYFSSYNQSAEDKITDIIAFYDSGISWSENLFEWIAELLVNIPFLILSVGLLNKYHLKIKSNYSNIAKISYTVVRFLIITTVILYLLEIVAVLLALAGNENAALINPVLYILCILIVYIAGYDALVRNREEPKSETVAGNIQSIDNENNKYQKNYLPDIKINQITDKINDCILNHKPYRNPEIRLNDFAKLINEHPNNVSQVLNDCFKKNFYDFINFYRVEESKLLLKNENYKNFTITAIGFEVGFNSKTAFYTAFKKFVNTTPAQFQKAD